MHEFTQIATPKESAYIQALHNIVQTEVIDRFEFTSCDEAKTMFENYVDWYNIKEKFGLLGRTRPQQKGNQHQSSALILSDQAEAANAEMEPTRNNLMNENDPKHQQNAAPVHDIK